MTTRLSKRPARGDRDTIYLTSTYLRYERPMRYERVGQQWTMDNCQSTIVNGRANRRHFPLPHLPPPLPSKNRPHITNLPLCLRVFVVNSNTCQLWWRQKKGRPEAADLQISLIQRLRIGNLPPRPAPVRPDEIMLNRGRPGGRTTDERPILVRSGGHEDTKKEDGNNSQRKKGAPTSPIFLCAFGSSW